MARASTNGSHATPTRGKPRGAAAPAPEPDPTTAALCDRVRDLRKRKGWTLEQLAAASGVSRSMLSEVELGRANPTVAVAHRIARAFGLSLGDLVDAPGTTPRVDVIRADDRQYHFRSDKDCRIRTLSPLRLEKSVEYYEIVLRPGGALRSAPHFAGARELLTVQRGAVRVRTGDDAADLGEGDSAHYPADVPHAIENAGDAEAICYLVVTYERD